MHLSTSPRIRRSPYFESTVAAGATSWTVYNKMLMPTSYGDVKAEYDRLVNGVAMWDVAAERQVQIEGPDADECAQYLSSRDLSSMVEGQGKYVAMCDHAGAILNDPVLLKLSGGRYWFSLADSDMLLWCKAVAAERGFDVKVTEPDVSPLAIQGPKAEDLVAELIGESVRSLKYFWFSETSLDGIPIVVCRSGWSKQGGFELFLQDGARGDELWDRVAEAGRRYDIGPGAPNAIERVESGLLSWGGDTTPDSNPYEALMGRFVNPDIDADFIGKDALAAVAAEGPARLMVGLVIDDDGAGSPMTPVRTPIRRNGEVVGTLSAMVRSPRLHATIGLGQVKAEVVEAGHPVEVDGPSGPATATIRSLPFL
ncbi:MAG: glycine cleavage system protein T [Acidimicrobiales bacterium]|nr:glycine cleavage system protein T [Acidimicrobiales bacterium]